jgi:hypothetical protein
MRTIEQGADRLILRQPSIMIYVGAACMVLVGLGMIGLGAAGIVGAKPGTELLLNSIVLAVLGAFIVVAAPLVRLLGVTITVIFDRAARAVRIERQRWFDRDERSVPFASIDDIVLESTDCDGSPVYRMALRLVSGATIPLTDGYDDLDRWKRKSVEAVREFLGCDSHTAPTNDV